MGNRPPRCGGAKAEPFLQCEVIDLVDHTVDIIAKRGTLRFDLFVMGDHIARSVAKCRERVGDKAQFRQTVDGALLRFGQRCRQRAPRVGEKTQGTRTGDFRIQLPQRPRSRVARIGKCFAAPFRLPLVQRREIGVAHIDFAAYL